jgi:signal transduction histidine kinase
MAISGYSELLLMDLSENDPLSKNIGQIKEQIDRLGEITKKLMRVTRYETKDYLSGKIVDIDKATD